MEFPHEFLQYNNKVSYERSIQTCNFVLSPDYLDQHQTWDYLSKIEKAENVTMMQTTHLLGQTTSLEESEIFLERLNVTSPYHILEFKFHNIESEDQIGRLFDVFSEWMVPTIHPRTTSAFPVSPKIIPSLKNLSVYSLASFINNNSRKEKEVIDQVPDGIRRFLKSVIECKNKTIEEETRVAFRLSIADPVNSRYPDTEGEHLFQAHLEKFYNRNEQRKWRNSTMIFFPNSSPNKSDFDFNIQTPSGFTKPVSEISQNIENALQGSSWQSVYGGCGGTFTSHLNRHFENTCQSLDWKSVQCTRDAFLTFGSLISNECGVWKNDKFSLSISFGATSLSQMEIIQDHFQTILFHHFNNFLESSNNFETRAWFGTSWNSKIFPETKNSKIQTQNNKDFVSPGDLRDIIDTLKQAEVHFDYSIQFNKLNEEELAQQTRPIQELFEKESEDIKQEAPNPSFLARMEKLFFHKKESPSQPQQKKKNCFWNYSFGGNYPCIFILYKHPKMGEEDDKNYQLVFGCRYCVVARGYIENNSTRIAGLHLSGSLCALHKSMVLYNHLQPNGPHLTQNGMKWATCRVSILNPVYDYFDMGNFQGSWVDPRQVQTMLGGLSMPGTILSHLHNWEHKSMTELLFS